MVVGDVVSDIGGDNVTLDFQPAVGVEAVISLWFGGLTNSNIHLFNGVDVSVNVKPSQITINLQAMKMFVNNTNFLRIIASGVGLRNAFTGIETNA